MTHKMLCINFLALMTCFSTGAFAGPDDLLPGRYNLQIPLSGRPAQPYRNLQNYNQDLSQSGVGADFTVPVSRHHIIPFNQLRAFYNAVVANGHLPRLRTFFNVYSSHIRYYAQNGGVDCTATGNDIIEAANLARGQGQGWVNGIAGASHQLAPGTDTFQEFYAWLPGNLFVGPNNRSDDPEGGFEEDAHFVVGAAAFDILSRLYVDMRQYVANNDVSLLEGINSRLNQLAMVRSVYSLNANNWVRGHDGKYHLRPSPSTLVAAHPRDPADVNIMPASCGGLEPTFDAVQARMIITLFDN